MNVSVNLFAWPNTERTRMQTWQTYVKGDLDLWEGHFSQVLISTIDGSKHQAKLQLQTNAKLIGTTNAKL